MTLSTQSIIEIIIGSLTIIGILINILFYNSSILTSIKNILLSMFLKLKEVITYLTPEKLKINILEPTKRFISNPSPLRSLFILAIVLIPTIILNIYATNKTIKTFTLWTSIVFGILGGIVFMSRINTSNKNETSKGIFSILTNTIKPFLLLCVGLFVIASTIYAISSFDTVSSLLSYATIIGGSIVGLYLLHSVISNTQLYKNLEKGQIFKILYHSIFLIPCYIVNSIKATAIEMKQESMFTYYLLLAEAIIIAGYFLLPKLNSYIFTHNGSLLLNKPVYLDQETQIGTFENLKHNDGFNYHYSLSFWAFINQNNPANAASERNSMIINYGGKPSVMYNVKENKLIITTKDGIDGEKQIYVNNNLPLQKWNNFVINYNSGIMDIFLNGTLVATQSNIMPYMKLDNVVVGSKNGIHGGIANVMYYNQNLTAYKIKELYNYFKNKTPPTI